MPSRTGVAMSTSPNLEEEGTVDTILLCAMSPGQITCGLSHKVRELDYVRRKRLFISDFRE